MFLSRYTTFLFCSFLAIVASATDFIVRTSIQSAGTVRYDEENGLFSGFNCIGAPYSINDALYMYTFIASVGYD
jgi:hypothetical protein